MYEILTQDLGVKCVVAKFVLRLLLPEQKEHRAAVANDLIQTATSEPDFLQKVITRDESRNQGQVVPMDVAWFSTPKKGRQSCSKIKTVCTVFLVWEGGVHHEYAPPGQTMSKEHYVSILQQLRGAVGQKRPQPRAAGDWQLREDNVPAHALRLVQSFLVKHQITQVTQPRYSAIQPRFGTLRLLAFPKTKITFEREEISDHR